MKTRKVVPEILDGLDPSDPEAIASRRDLRLINYMMGNERWILRRIAACPDVARRGIVEVGAGEGMLLLRLARFGPVTGLDIARRPDALDRSITWMRQDLFDAAGSLSGGILVACLFLHHFEDDRLVLLAELMRRFEVICFVEPLRHPLALACGGMMLPFVNRVTRHDMPISIRAGFIRGQLPRLLGLADPVWEVSETCSWRGGLRLLARRSFAQ